MGYHRDEGENDGHGDEPVVSISLGNSSEFAVKHTRDEPARTILLESGDAILFGGACRKILHSVVRVLPQTSPPWLNGIVRDARLNFTFRCAPEALGRESTDFQYYLPGRGKGTGAAAAGGHGDADDGSDGSTRGGGDDGQAALQAAYTVALDRVKAIAARPAAGFPNRTAVLQAAQAGLTEAKKALALHKKSRKMRRRPNTLGSG